MTVLPVEWVMNSWIMETLILEDLRKAAKLEKGLTIGLLQIKCILEIGVEVFRMEKENILAAGISMKGIFAME